MSATPTFKKGGWFFGAAIGLLFAATLGGHGVSEQEKTSETKNTHIGSVDTLVLNDKSQGNVSINYDQRLHDEIASTSFDDSADVQVKQGALHVNSGGGLLLLPLSVKHIRIQNSVEDIYISVEHGTVMPELSVTLTGVNVINLSMDGTQKIDVQQLCVQSQSCDQTSIYLTNSRQLERFDATLHSGSISIDDARLSQGGLLKLGADVNLSLNAGTLQNLKIETLP